MPRLSWRSGVMTAAWIALSGLSAAACAQVLDLDEALSSADASVVPDDDGGGGGSDGSSPSDATVADAGDAGDASSLDAMPGDAEDAGDAFTSGSWHVDDSFRGGACYELLGGVDEVVDPIGLTLLGSPDGGVIAVGVTTTYVLTVHDVSNPSAPIFQVDVSDPVDDDYSSNEMTGAVVDGDRLLAITDSIANGHVRLTRIDLTTATVTSPPGSTETDQLFAGVLGASDGSVLALGSSLDADPVTGVELTVTLGESQAQAPSLGPGKLPTVLKAGFDAGAGTTWYGGTRDVGNGAFAAYGYDRATGGQAVILPNAGDEGAGITALFAVGTQVYAVGFLDSDFTFVALPAAGLDVDASALSVSRIASGGNQSFYAEGDLGLSWQVQLEAAVDERQRVLVGGNFDGTELANFQLDGGTDLQGFVTRTDGGLKYSNVLDLGSFLPPLSTNGWTFQSMLLQGNFLYVAVADNDHHWAVVRLVRSDVP